MEDRGDMRAVCTFNTRVYQAKRRHLHNMTFYLVEQTSRDSTIGFKTMLESSWPHTQTISQFGCLTIPFLAQNQTLSSGHVFEPSLWTCVRQNKPSSHQKIMDSLCSYTRPWLLWSSNRKGNPPGTFDKKYNFKLVSSAGIQYTGVHVWKDTCQSSSLQNWMKKSNHSCPDDPNQG